MVLFDGSPLASSELVMVTRHGDRCIFWGGGDIAAGVWRCDKELDTHWQVVAELPVGVLLGVLYQELVGVAGLAGVVVVVVVAVVVVVVVVTELVVAAEVLAATLEAMAWIACEGNMESSAAESGRVRTRDARMGARAHVHVHPLSCTRQA